MTEKMTLLEKWCEWEKHDKLTAYMVAEDLREWLEEVMPLLKPPDEREEQGNLNLSYRLGHLEGQKAAKKRWLSVLEDKEEEVKK